MQNSDFIILFLMIAIFMGAIHRYLTSSGSFIVILYCLPFTIMHEAAHFAIAMITGGRPSSFSVWPRRVAGGWVLGSVSSVPTLFSAAPAALAPLGWLVVGYYSMALWDFRPVWLPDYMIWVILYACSAACSPSCQDVCIAIKHPLSLLFWSGMLYMIITFWPAVLRICSQVVML